MPPSQPILRFAPSPNGHLHLGHAYSALFTAYWAQRLGGTFLLRIEDIDTARCRPEFTAAIFDDLHWLGLDWPEPVMVQSGRFPVYEAAARQLDRMGLLYPCFCTRRDIARNADGRTDPDGAPVYPGTCRHLSGHDVRARLDAGTPHQLRLKTDVALARTGSLAIAETMPTPDMPARQRPADPARWGDVVLVRKDTPTSYHLAVVVDDAAQGVTHVTRGRDLEAATDIHRLLQALLGLKSPLYCHHGLITDEADDKLAKSRGSTSLGDLRAAGVTAGEIRERLGFAEDW